MENFPSIAGIRRKRYLYTDEEIPDRTKKRHKHEIRVGNQETASSEIEEFHEKKNEPSCGFDDDPNFSSPFKLRESTNSNADLNSHGVDCNLNSVLDVFNDLNRISEDCVESNDTDPALLPSSSNLQYFGGSFQERMNNIGQVTTISPSNGLDNPLTHDTETTEGDAMLMCLALGLRHSLSWVAMVDILSFVNYLFGRDVIRATKYFLLKYMDTGSNDITYHIYCDSSHCKFYIGTKSDLNPKGTTKEFTCPKCKKEINMQGNVNYFLSLNLKSQIAQFLKDPKFVNGINYRFERDLPTAGAYQDIFDGEVYRELSQPGQPLSFWYNMSYTFNTDGAPIGKSGGQSCWPIYVQINELSPRLRNKYMILAGIYVGPENPDMNLFLDFFVNEANNLSTSGIDWEFNGQTINSLLIPISCCVDSIARCKVLNMKQFNGNCGCTLCYATTTQTAKGPRYTLPFVNTVPERTHLEILSDSLETYDNRLEKKKKRVCVRGCKGPTPIHNLQHMDIVRGVRPDPMHSIMMGNVKQHLSLLIESSGKPFYIGSDIRFKSINKRLLSITPPTSILRTARNLKNYSTWKAKELRNWLLFFSIVCLMDIIPNEYIEHLAMLSAATHILFGRSITPEHLSEAHNLLLSYASTYQTLFGEHSMVFNIHLLLHLKSSVECLGPLWTQTAFAFEAENKTILQFRKGTSSLALEIARKYLIFKSLPFLCEEFASSPKSVEFCENLSDRKLKSYLKQGKVTLLGKGYSNVSLNEEERSCLDQFSDCKEIVFLTKLCKMANVSQQLITFGLGTKLTTVMSTLKN